MSAWLDKDILRQSKKHPAFVVNPKALLITHADMDVRAPSEMFIFSIAISLVAIQQQMAIQLKTNSNCPAEVADLVAGQ
jgi:hypothetical protein